MHSSLKKLEHITDRVIPYLLILLAAILIVEFFFKEIALAYHNLITTGDLIIVLFFSMDLAFKFNRVRKVKLFLKKYWLDIIAVFPFFLLFRLVEEVFFLFRLSPELSEGQKFFHIGLETEKFAKEERALRELAELQKETRLTRTRLFARFFRLPRLIKIFPFYEKPIKKEIKVIEKDIEKLEKKTSKKKKSKAKL
ncbi:hypothetical protein HYV89_02925 [Candidatus Woesearchaeota archaeon]|nr:hypothetical protein [Candidatus Woesearchaeota archaeon]